eukprot:6191030-Pleurochrysis_carterae.AAC.2
MARKADIFKAVGSRSEGLCLKRDSSTSLDETDVEPADAEIIMITHRAECISQEESRQKDLSMSAAQQTRSGQRFSATHKRPASPASTQATDELISLATSFSHCVISAEGCALLQDEEATDYSQLCDWAEECAALPSPETTRPLAHRPELLVGSISRRKVRRMLPYLNARHAVENV